MTVSISQPSSAAVCEADSRSVSPFATASSYPGNLVVELANDVQYPSGNCTTWTAVMSDSENSSSAYASAASACGESSIATSVFRPMPDATTGVDLTTIPRFPGSQHDVI